MSIKFLQEQREVTGYHQLAAGSMATAATIPGTGGLVMIQAEAQNVRYTLDGSTPTTTVGFLLQAGETHTLNVGQGNIGNIKVIQAASGAILNVHTFK